MLTFQYNVDQEQDDDILHCDLNTKYKNVLKGVDDRETDR